MKNLILLMVLSSINACGGKKSKEFYGRVTDTAGNALPGTWVILSGSDRKIQTDINGFFTLAKPKDFLPDLVFVKEGYVTDTQPVVGTHAGEQLFYRFEKKDSDIVRLKKIPGGAPALNNTILSESFVGKTTAFTDSLQLHECWGFFIADSFSVSSYSVKVDSCRNGSNKIILQKLLEHSPSGKPVFIITDELNVTTNDPEKCFSVIWKQFQDGQKPKPYLVQYTDKRIPILGSPAALWEIDLQNQKLKQVQVPENFEFPNPDYTE